MKPQLKKLAAATVALAALAVNSFAQIASDNGGNYGSGWVDGSNGGSGFGNWIFNMTSGNGSAGAFIGDPASGGVSGMSSTSFGFYANPIGSGANAEVSRPFSSALASGDTFSFQWGLNWDSDDANSNRGFNLFAGSSQLLNINMANSSNITIQGAPMFTQFGNQAFTVNFEQLSPTSIRVYGIGRDGSESYDNTFTGLAGAADGFSFYFNATEQNDNRQMYMNNLSIVPEPSTYALLGLGAASILWRFRRRKLS